MELRLEATGLYRRFGSVQVLDGLDLELGAGECIAVQGASGTGKSTLLNCLGLLDRPDAGSIRFAGLELTNLSDGARARFRATRLGFVFQGFHLLPEFSVLENILMAARAARVPLAAAKRDALQLLARVGLADRAHQQIPTLSGGEAQRVALCRALVLSPDLILADEPTGNLDPGTAAEVLALVLDLVRDLGASAIIVTHSPEVAATANRCLVLHHGQLSDRERPPSEDCSET